MTTLRLFGTDLQITAIAERRTSEYGTPRPTLVLRIAGTPHHKVVRALAHQVAAHLELDLLATGLESLVQIEDASEWWEGRRRLGGQICIGLELIGEERRCPLTVETDLANTVIEGMAGRINAGRTQ